MQLIAINYHNGQSTKNGQQIVKMDTPSLNKFCRKQQGFILYKPLGLSFTYLILETGGQSTIIGEAELFVIRNINMHYQNLGFCFFNHLDTWT